MKLLSLTPYVTEPQTTGRFSDGSDRVIVPGVTRYRADVLSSDGARHQFDFAAPPTADDIAERLPAPATDLTPTLSKAALLPIVKVRISEAQSFDWFNTKAQADGALTAPQKAKVAALNTTLYQRARAAVAAWYAAT